jgi:hypothetical protein
MSFKTDHIEELLISYKIYAIAIGDPIPHHGSSK